MIAIGGLAFLLACVFGSFIASGGAIAPLLKSLPFEVISIGGSATGAFLMSNSMSDVKHTLGALTKALRGARFRKTDYLDLLTLLFRLVKLASARGAMAVETHIENPTESSIFQAHPKVLGNRHALVMVCDYFRMIGMNADDPHQIEDVMARELKKQLHEELHPSHALQTVADGLPALGIVAAVLGVIKTMGHINESPAVLGEMIGGALTGTFLGVLLAYGVAGPLAARLRGVVEEESKFFELIRAVLVAHLHGNAPQVSVESGRKLVPSGHMPTFGDLEQALQNAPAT